MSQTVRCNAALPAAHSSLAATPMLSCLLCLLPGRGSVYMHKDRDGPLAAGPAWDYNEAYGLCCGYPIEGWDKQGVSAPGGWVGGSVGGLHGS